MKEETVNRIRKFTEDRDWDQFHSPSNLAKSIVIDDYSHVIAPVVADLCTTPVALSAPPNSYQYNSQS